MHPMLRREQQSMKYDATGDNTAQNNNNNSSNRHAEKAVQYIFCFATFQIMPKIARSAARAIKSNVLRKTEYVRNNKQKQKIGVIYNVCIFDLTFTYIIWNLFSILNSISHFIISINFFLYLEFFFLNLLVF